MNTVEDRIRAAARAAAATVADGSAPPLSLPQPGRRPGLRGGGGRPPWAVPFAAAAAVIGIVAVSGGGPVKHVATNTTLPRSPAPLTYTATAGLTEPVRAASAAPIPGENASVPMITKGGLNAITRSLAIEYAKQGIRFNAVAPGMVDTPPHNNDPIDFIGTLHPLGEMVEVNDVTDAVLYLAAADQVSGEIVHLDRAARTGRW